MLFLHCCREYRQATTRDYSKDGFFLDKVIISKVIGDQVWRFNSAEQPLHLEEFRAGERFDHPPWMRISQNR